MSEGESVPQEWVEGEVRLVDIGETYICPCGRESSDANVTNTGKAMKAWCPDCQGYIKFVSKAKLGIPTRQIGERDGIKPSVRHRVMAADNFKCVACGSDTNLHIDHIIPVLQGGDESPSNLVTLCEECNLGKGSYAPVKAMFLLMLKAARTRKSDNG